MRSSFGSGGRSRSSSDDTTHFGLATEVRENADFLATCMLKEYTSVAASPLSQVQDDAKFAAARRYLQEEMSHVLSNRKNLDHK